MEKPGKQNFDWKPFLWKGALGGAIGSVLVVLLGASYLWRSFGKSALRDLPLSGAVFGLVAGAMVGFAIGLVIFSATRKWGKQPGGATRVVIGFGCVLACSLAIDLTKSWPAPLTFTLAFAALVGGLAGLMAKTKVATNNHHS